MLRAALLFIGLVACAPASPAPQVEATRTETTKTEATKTGPPAIGCTERVAAMRDLFAQRPDGPVMISALDGMQLPETRAGGPIEDALLLFIRADGSFEFTAQSFTTVAALKEMLGEEFDKVKQLGENVGQPFRPRLLLIADARARATVIRDLAAELPADTTVSLIAALAGDTVPTPPPSPAAVQAAMAAPADQRSQRIAALVAPAIGSCTAVQDVFANVAETTADMRATVLFEGLPAAIERCRCEGIEVETVVAVVWSMHGKHAPKLRSLLLPLAGKREAGATMVPATATVSDLVRLAEASDAKPIRFAEP